MTVGKSGRLSMRVAPLVMRRPLPQMLHSGKSMLGAGTGVGVGLTVGMGVDGAGMYVITARGMVDVSEAAGAGVSPFIPFIAFICLATVIGSVESPSSSPLDNRR